MPKKQVKGLLDYMALKPDEEWDFAPNSEEYVHGMGMGASKDAIRWAYMGYMLEMRQGMIKFKKNVGRKKQHKYESVHCQRAMRIWLFVNQEGDSQSEPIHNQYYIKILKLYFYLEI